MALYFCRRGDFPSPSRENLPAVRDGIIQIPGRPLLPWAAGAPQSWLPARVRAGSGSERGSRALLELGLTAGPTSSPSGS